VTDMHPFEVWKFVSAAMRELTRGADGWPRGWCSGFVITHRGDDRFYEARATFDRDRCDVGTAGGWAKQLESQFGAAHPGAARISLWVEPTTRIEVVLELVKDHFEAMAYREADKMKRAGTPWVVVGDIEIRRGWKLDEDRVIADLYADSSADEGNAQRLGQSWFASLVADYPELAGVVEITGSSH